MKEITPAQVPAGAQIIDVRNDDEFAAGHARGAIHIQMDTIPGRLDEIDDTQDVYVICEMGGRSAKVVNYLATRGIDAINIDGGTRAWKAANLPME